MQRKKKDKMQQDKHKKISNTLPNVPTIIVTPLDPQDATKLILGSPLFSVTKHV
jgi:hypothetical protein